MKKNIFILLILCNVLTGCAKDYSSKIFKDCFNKSDESYEFNIRNPFFVDEFYVKDVKKLKNKIIKKTIESYYLDKEGRKSYGDSYDRNVGYLYYFFNSEGRITDKYYVNVTDDGEVFYKQKTTFNCNEDSYEIVNKNFVRESEKTYHAKIEKKDIGLLLSFNDVCDVFDNFDEIEFTNNKIVKRRIFNHSISINELLIDNDLIQQSQYRLEDNEKSYWGITNYQNCYQIKQKRFVPSGDEFYECTLDETGHGIRTFFKEGKNQDKEILQEVYRRFTPIGFLEYEEKKPYKTKVGYYDITEITVLSKKDDMFISHFE